MRATLVWVAVVAGCGRVNFAPLVDDGDVQPDGPVAPLTVTGLTLVPATTLDAPALGVVTPGVSIDITSAIGTGVSIRADVAGTPSRIEAIVNGTFSNESEPPYFTGGNSPTVVYRDRELRIGPNTVAITAFGADDTAGSTLTVDFTLTLDVTMPMTITGVNLIDNDTGGNVLATLTGNDTIPLASLSTPSGLIDVRIYTMPTHVGSVRTAITGSLSHTDSDNWAFYTGWNEAGWAPAAGTYQLSFTPYSVGESMGVAGTTAVYDLTITP